MTVLGLDLSLHCGWAVIQAGKLVGSGTIDHDRRQWTHRLDVPVVEDYDAIATAKSIGTTAATLSAKYSPDLIYLEQTNGSSFRTSQKLLEFIHYAVLESLFPGKVRYVNTSKWKSLLGIRMSKEQRDHNKAVKAKTAKGKITSKHLSVAWANQTFSLHLKLVNNDEADAIAVAQAGYLMSQWPPDVKIPDVNKAFSS